MKILAIILTSLLCANLMAQKYISGKITRDTRWIGDIYVNGDVNVEKGVILSIESGSRIFFKANTDVQAAGIDKKHSEIVVNGTLIARGHNPQSPIIFTSQAENARMNDWYGIVIKNSNQKSVLEDCVIEFGYKGITCYGSSPIIKDSEIRFNYNSGISCEVRAKPAVNKCVVMGNGFAGINCELASAPVVNSTIITQNRYGVIAFTRSNPDLGHYPTDKNRSSGENKIFNNFEYDIYNHTINEVYAQNNYWNTNKTVDIAAAIFDNTENATYGEVVFDPIYLKKPRPRFIFPVLAEEAAAGETTAAKMDTVPSEQPPPAANLTFNTLPDTNADSNLLQNSVHESLFVAKETVEVKPETVYVYKEPEPPEPPKPEKKEEFQIQEPIIEAFLDSGKREYLRRVKPKYPDIYRQTGMEGDVLIEVVVDRTGNVENYRVLKSDGELFTDAAVFALSKFKYKPGTFRGIPIKYKIVERFSFQQ